MRPSPAREAASPPTRRAIPVWRSASALTFAIFALVTGVVLIRQQQQRLYSGCYEIGLKPAFVAARDLESGAIVTDQDISTADFPGLAMERMFGHSRVMERWTMVGARTTSRLEAGQVFTRHHFTWPCGCLGHHGGCR